MSNTTEGNEEPYDQSRLKDIMGSNNVEKGMPGRTDIDLGSDDEYPQHEDKETNS